MCRIEGRQPLPPCASPWSRPLHKAQKTQKKPHIVPVLSPSKEFAQSPHGSAGGGAEHCLCWRPRICSCCDSSSCLDIKHISGLSPFPRTKDGIALHLFCATLKKQQLLQASFSTGLDWTWTVTSSTVSQQHHMARCGCAKVVTRLRSLRMAV